MAVITITALIIPNAIGTHILKNMVNSPAPSISAASTYPFDIAENKPKSIR